MVVAEVKNCSILRTIRKCAAKNPKKNSECHIFRMMLLNATAMSVTFVYNVLGYLKYEH